MRILVIYAHPDPDSYGAALHRTVLDALAAAGHEVDDCDLYREGFDPVLSLPERRAYHDIPGNRSAVDQHVDRLTRAEGLVLIHPVWNFGQPAILKGYLDRVFLPGVSFVIRNGQVEPNLRHLRFVACVCTYGASRWRAFLMGDPPRKIMTRMMRVLVAPRARMRYLALYDMNRATADVRAAFLQKIKKQFLMKID